MLTNLIVVPLATLILYLGASLFVFSFIKPVASILAKLLIYTVKGLNMSVSFIEQLPFSTTKNISINLPEMFLIYILILMLCFFLIYKRTRYLQIGLATLVILLSVNFYKHYKVSNQKEFFVYNISGSSALNFIDGKNNILFCDSALIKEKKGLMYAAQNNWIYKKVPYPVSFDINSINSNDLQSVNKNNLSFSKNCFNYYGKKIYLLHDIDILNYESTKKLELDYLIISNNLKVSLEDILKLFHFECLIFDSSNSYWLVNTMKQECEDKGINNYSVSNEGAFSLQL
jgi:competence protein ComEC